MSVRPELIRRGRVDSTQDLVHQLGAENAAAGTAVVAVEQVAGRGAHGRAWHSAPGGLWLSILLRPSSAGVGLISLRVGVTTAMVLETMSGGVALGLKWPNDLMLGEAKVGGILCEARWQGDIAAWVAVGIGINVTNPVPSDARYGAARLADWSPSLTADAIAEPLVAALAAVDYDRPSLSGDELAAFEHRDSLRGRQLQEPIAGVADGIAPDGALRVRTPAGGALAYTGTVVPAAAGLPAPLI